MSKSDMSDIILLHSKNWSFCVLHTELTSFVRL